jgi:hypothetical protein
MSENLRARCDAADAEYERETARQERERQERLAMRRESDVIASIRMAEDRGELIDVRRAYADGGIGRTVSEVVDYASAMADIEDAREVHRQQKAFQAFLLRQSAATSADTTALSAEDGHQMQQRAAKFREKIRDRVEVRQIAGEEAHKRIKLAMERGY